MGSSWSKENKTADPTTDLVTAKTGNVQAEINENRPGFNRSGSKRSAPEDEPSQDQHDKKSKNSFKKKKSANKKDNKDNKDKKWTKELQPRPEHLGPKEARVPKKKVALLVGFNGTGYQGMQLNPNIKSIEGAVFDALVKAGGISKDNSDDPKKSAWMRSARTDKGVHAAGNVITFKMQIHEDYDVIERTNSFLPEQIRVWGYVLVQNSFHAKDFCDSRIYEYLLPTCAFMEPEQKILTDTPTREDDIAITHDRYNNLPAKYVARSTPEFIQQRHDYRATPEQLAKFKEVMKTFEGTHNFHNYTNGKSFRDMSSKRYIMSIDVTDPFYMDGSEWLSIKLHGQSFILHQIRKMISMGMLVVRSDSPVSLIPKSFEENRINIPKAPALGLLLERPVFKSYNDRMEVKEKGVKRDELTFDPYQEKIKAFKEEWIYKKIFEAENQEHVFDGYLTSLDAHIGPDYLYLNKEGIIPNECLISTKYNTIKTEDDDEVGEGDK